MSVKAPWTEEQVNKLNEFQSSRRMHPFTCGSGNRTDEAHKTYQAQHGGDFGQLVATTDGWRCPVCDYRQDWAHEFMFKGAPPDPFAALRPTPLSSLALGGEE